MIVILLIQLSSGLTYPPSVPVSPNRSKCWQQLFFRDECKCYESCPVEQDKSGLLCGVAASPKGDKTDYTPDQISCFANECLLKSAECQFKTKYKIINN